MCGLCQALIRTLSSHIEFVNLNVEELMATLASSSLEDLDSWRVRGRVVVPAYLI